MRNISKYILVSAAPIVLVACAEQGTDSFTEADRGEDVTAELTAAEAVEPEDIVGVAEEQDDLSTLVTAMTLAGLGETLSDDGPYTVFAPTNDAFNKVDPDELREMMTPENKDDLKNVLNYHVIVGKMTAADVVQAIEDDGGSTSLKTVQGNELKASLDGEKVVLEDAAGGKSTITLADVTATNGVIHAIDRVVMPG